MSRSSSTFSKEMSNRYISLIISGILVLPIFVIGPEQYGYAFFGLCSFLGQFAKVIGAEAPIWALILNFAIIGLMIQFSISGLIALFSLILMTLINFKEKTKRIMKVPPVIFAGIVLFGLIGISLFPGEPKIEIGNEFYYAPSLLLLVASLSLLIKEGTEQVD